MAGYDCGGLESSSRAIYLALQIWVGLWTWDAIPMLFGGRICRRRRKRRDGAVVVLEEDLADASLRGRVMVAESQDDDHHCSFSSSSP
ncbi:unnamed protein product [Linum trigynum]|uniref:Uncharacterized protein n=1 Tax=Linum trigynum TaxID=586398 RepID=A0AAV2CDZ3_9ROSI